MSVPVALWVHCIAPLLAFNVQVAHLKQTCHALNYAIRHEPIHRATTSWRTRESRWLPDPPLSELLDYYHVSRYQNQLEYRYLRANVQTEIAAAVNELIREMVDEVVDPVSSWPPRRTSCPKTGYQFSTYYQEAWKLVDRAPLCVLQAELDKPARVAPPRFFTVKPLSGTRRARSPSPSIKEAKRQKVEALG